ncbi:hypothetical protein J3R30DRAFT_687621 [Lentinula aciculospora]|uniref:Uncharacterized protein n=1 Tax=Lentinula aciculospora TaxID=153920 RepID=A0A9W9DK31_9AGAR|nr:hypothetical protein J3R30DRAFT_687621 [Lentinula aciculospora]
MYGFLIKIILYLINFIARFFTTPMPSSTSLIPLAYIDELNELWEYDERFPTLSSRRKWATARDLQPRLVNEWWWAQRRKARERGVALSCENYHLPVGNPPKVSIKTEPADEDLIALNSSPTNDRLSIPLDLSSEDSSISSLLSLERLGTGSPRTSLPPSSDQDKKVDICAHTNEENRVLENLLPCGLRLPPEFFPSHEQSPVCLPQDLNINDDVMLFDAESPASIDLRPIQSKLRSASFSSPQHSKSTHPSCYSFLSLDGKTFTPNGFFVAQTAEPEDPDIFLVETFTKPCDFPLLSELSDSNYLPPLVSAEAVSIEPGIPSGCIPSSALTHRWYRRHVDSPQYDTIIDVDPGLDTNTLEYHAFSKHLYLQWIGDERWLMRKELYVP